MPLPAPEGVGDFFGLLGIHSIGGYVWCAFVGATVAHAIGATGCGAVSPVRLVLAGVALSAVLGGIVTAFIGAPMLILLARRKQARGL
ncbi:hypothetical protein ACFFP0_07025 [Rhizobium puerariae]|uniref:Uncharacterized protein n=1 Tax=Rhizobium puerariae TaxID=1585791 RepID=A0ABV6AH14_9HYPH